jgi:dihydroorotate dehydrogenase (fumarate)
MINLGSIALDSPIMNAAGTCRTLEDVKRFARSSVSAVVLGSVTVEPQTGNTGNVYYDGIYYSLNALGLPNPGMDYYNEHIDEITQVVHGAGKPLIVSIAGGTPAEYATLRHFFESCGVDGIEYNFSCPNVWLGGKQKSMFCFDIASIFRVLQHSRWQYNTAIGVKVSPFSDPSYLIEVAEAIDDYVDWITACNTFPNAIKLRVRTGEPVIGVKLAGLSGMAMNPIALGQVFQYNQVLRRTKIVGAGGISTGQDVKDFLTCGASAVQVNTAYSNTGDLEVYTKILEEYAARI